MSRTVRVTAGDRDYVWFNATEINGANVTADTVVVGFGTYSTPPASSIALSGASDLVQHPTVSTIRAGLFVAADNTVPDGAHVVTPGDYYGWIKPTDAPSVAWVKCGPVSIT